MILILHGLIDENGNRQTHNEFVASSVETLDYNPSTKKLVVYFVPETRMEFTVDRAASLMTDTRVQLWKAGAL